MNIENHNYINYYTKNLIILVIVFVILKFFINMNLYDAILLSCIIITSILIIEKILSLNSSASNPKNCDQCKISNDNNEHFAPTYSNDNYFSKPDFNIDSPFLHTPELQALELQALELQTPELQAPKLQAPKLPVPMLQAPMLQAPNLPAPMLQAPMLQAPNLRTHDLQAGDLEIPVLNILTPEHHKILQSMPLVINNLKSNPTYSKFAHILESLDLQKLLTQQPKIMEIMQLLYSSAGSPQLLMQSSNIMEGLKLLETMLSSLQPQQQPQYQQPQQQPQYQQQQQQQQQQQPQQQPQQQYQEQRQPQMPLFQKPMQPQMEVDNSATDLKKNIERLYEGDKRVTESYIKDGNNYYNNIYARSNPSDQKVDMISELKYGDFNYISPLNKGMANKSYTFISPDNWYPIAPVPPVCVTNRSCLTSPVVISSGQDYMNWADVNDFDKSRRFTGNMGINIDYVKEVLNNSDGY